MKKSFTILMLSIILYFVPGWNETMAQELLDFYGYYNNPVLDHGGSGTYDETALSPFTIWDDGIFYLFYSGSAGVCVATSLDGYDYTKLDGENPVFTASVSGFDSKGVYYPVILKVGTEWIMYYGASQSGAPFEYIGRATADSLTGSWERSSDPVLARGGPGEWDSGIICANSVIPLDTGGFIMFYFAANNNGGSWLMGMATSPDGISWTKYNDPLTTQAPYADSDPILPAGSIGEFDEWGVAGAAVLKNDGYYGGYYHMYYAGYAPGPNGFSSAIGYAYSTDGIIWNKYVQNPIFSPGNDPYFDETLMIFESPCILAQDSTVYLYYDYGLTEHSIGLATADNSWCGINDREITDYELRITNYPNPVYHLTTLYYTLNKPCQVKLEIYDSFGRLVDVPANKYQQKGEQQVVWNAEPYPAGIYYYRLQADGKSGGGIMIIIK